MAGEGLRRDRALLLEGETADTALGGAVGVIQPATGFRFSIDAILLARFAAEGGYFENAVDLCAGSGVVGFCLLALGAAKKVTGIDIQPDFVGRAERGAEWNGFCGRAKFRCRDVKAVPASMPSGAYDLVVCNPPYRPLHGGKVSKEPSLAIARYEVSMNLEDAVRGGSHLLKKGGEFSLVYPAGGVARVLSALEAEGLTPKRLRFLHPDGSSPASLVLAGAVKGKKEPLKVLAPLILHDRESGRKYSAEAEHLLGRP
ncbi:methyltransferase domain-containing protein [bacterium]|nr:MAG: methyltransferase domain-containing protein [bacterium]